MAEKLKGLLDRANSVLGGLLGDFPQGFNAGAVAGVAGYPGDIAYMLDTAGRALTGQHTQPSAQDFPGTTEYLAAKAGYPVPQSFSGQLGAAVGGILTPGPGDLAKFAPVLSAIPFWHGSPHKYDVVDLAHIGSGEGAQAYGWGYYGGQAKETGDIYRRTTSAPFDKFTFKGRPISEVPGAEGNVAAQLNFDMSSGKRFDQAKDDLAKYLAENDQQEELAALSSIRKEDFGIQEHGGYLYQGEYRWPDPAKEAATPLTGEDLLDWDKPLSEQSDSVKAVLRRSPLAPDESVWPQWTGQQLYESEVRAGTDFDGIAKGDARANLSEHLRQAGIPGIRYLDQMSRGAGEGTRNYVMFDDKGIKLLERNGEPIPAAAEFAARREGKPKPYREAMGIESPPPAPDYGINHRPPMRNSGAPLFDVTGGGNVYPDDVYSAKAQQYYGTGDPKLDRDTFRVLQAYRNEPDAPVTIYRAVPANVDANDINAGDWVTINKAYADMHGQGFDGGYKIIKKQVKAKDIYTNGDSIHEWGYDPN